MSVFFPGKNSKTQSSLNFLQSGLRKFTISDFSGLAPIRRVLKFSGKKKAHKHKSFWPVTPSGDRGVFRPGGQGSKFYVLSSELKEQKSFCPDTRPGGPVTGATGKSFMCKSYVPFLLPKFGPVEEATNTRLHSKCPEGTSWLPWTPILALPLQCSLQPGKHH